MILYYIIILYDIILFYIILYMILYNILTWAHRPMGLWAHVPMGPWAHGPYYILYNIYMKTALFHLKFMLEARMPPGDPQETPMRPPESPREPQRAPETIQELSRYCIAWIAWHRLHCIDGLA